MEITEAIVVIAFMTALVLLVAVIYNGYNQGQLRKAQQSLGASSEDLREMLGQVLNVLDQTRQEQARITSRLENLETIVTSEAWTPLHAGPRAEKTLLLNEGALQEPAPEEAAERLAKRLRG